MRRFDMYIPENLADLLQYLDEHQTGHHLIANGSDLINRIQRKQVNPKTIVDLSGLSEFNYVRKEGKTVKIGALTTISDLASSPIIDSRLEAFREVASKFGGPSITNVATVGGNICAASSSEDLLPVFLILDAKVKLLSTHGERIMLVEEFLKGKRLTDLKSNEILTEVMFEGPAPNSSCAFEKVGMRNSLIIALVNSAVLLTLEKGTRSVMDIRIAFNRVTGKIPQRARKVEEQLRGARLTDEKVASAVVSLRNELKLSSDFRASEEYRTSVAGALFTRALNRCAERLIGATIIV